jgi:6-phosphogluconolactonase
MPIHPSKDPILHSFASTDALQGALVEFILKAQKESIEKKGRFAVAFSGGSLPRTLKGLIGNPDVKWDKW